MFVNRYIEVRYDEYLKKHLNNHCNCNLEDGGLGLCHCGRYLEGMITPQEFLKEINDKFYNIQYGTFIRTDTDDIARIIAVEKVHATTYFILDREVECRYKDGYITTNKIKIGDDIEKHSNNLKDLVKIGDIVNGYKIIQIEGDRLKYGYWGNDYISGDVNEVLTRKDYIKKSIVNIKQNI